MNWYKIAKKKYRQKGETLWFEYHCNESSDSPDAPAWYHSHQKATILSLEENGYGNTLIERIDNGMPAVYKVRFEDGLEWDVFEDELMDSPDDFHRPDPPSDEIKEASVSPSASSSSSVPMTSTPISQEVSVSPQQVYTRNDVIQTRDDIAPSKLRKKKKKKRI